MQKTETPDKPNATPSGQTHAAGLDKTVPPGPSEPNAGPSQTSGPSNKADAKKPSSISNTAPTQEEKEEPKKTSPPSNPCEELERLLKEWKQQSEADGTKPPQGRLEKRKPLQDDVIGRAIAGVTEAISNNAGLPGEGSTQYSLTNSDEIGNLYVERTIEFLVWEHFAQVTRPGMEAFIIRIDGTEGQIHNLLYFLRQVEGYNFELVSYDTAKRDVHRHNNQKVANEFHGHLTKLKWGHWDHNLVIAPGVRSVDPPARQLDSWDCGIYVVLYAWALALGLDILEFKTLDRSRQNEFIDKSLEMIAQSLQGHCNSATIEAFLKCYGLVDRNAEIQPGHRFDRTVAFPTQADFERHVQRLRIAADLESSGVGFSLEEALRAIGRFNPRFGDRLADHTVGEIVDRYYDALDRLKTADVYARYQSEDGPDTETSDVRDQETPNDGSKIPTPAKRPREDESRLSSRKKSKSVTGDAPGTTL